MTCNWCEQRKKWIFSHSLVAGVSKEIAECLLNQRRQVWRTKKLDVWLITWWEQGNLRECPVKRHGWFWSLFYLQMLSKMTNIAIHHGKTVSSVWCRCVHKQFSTSGLVTGNLPFKVSELGTLNSFKQNCPEIDPTQFLRAKKPPAWMNTTVPYWTAQSLAEEVYRLVTVHSFVQHAVYASVNINNQLPGPGSMTRA